MLQLESEAVVVHRPLLLREAQCFLIKPSADSRRPHIVEDDLLYSKSADLNINSF